MGIAEALISMGATRRNVNKDKFGAELREVLEQIANIQPQVVITANQISGTNGLDNGFGNLSSFRSPFHGLCPAIIGTMEAQIDADERETTNLVLQVVQVAERNGLKLPREFGLILKQVHGIDTVTAPEEFSFIRWPWLNVGIVF